MRYEKIIFNSQRRNELFFIFIYHSSLIKGAMNAARICKLRNGVKKPPKFLLFSMAKGNQVRNEYSPQLSKLMA
jgi:hypothetical protein